jgi:uncharacterized protein with GYD domain
VFYLAHGSDDFFIIVDLPDHVSAVATSLIVNAAGGAKATSTPLITPEQVDQATKKAVDYRPPGQ